MTVRPSPDFNWIAVSWGGPDEVVAGECSYCDAPLSDEEMPLIMWNEIGWCARFCEACQRRYFGMETLPDDAAEENS